MAKKQAAKLTDTLDTVKPYLERALTDEEFRNDLKDALKAARELYGPLSKQNGVAGKLHGSSPFSYSAAEPAFPYCST